MAYKTMLRQLISKWGIMSIDLVQAIDADMAVIHEDGTKDYVESDADMVVADVPTEEEERPEPAQDPTPEPASQPAPQHQDAASAFFG